MKIKNYVRHTLIIGGLLLASIPCAHAMYKKQESWFDIPAQNKIMFYDKKQPHYEFTSFADGYPITLDGKTWPTAEQYYQAMKFQAEEHREIIRNFKSDNTGSAAYKAFKYAQQHANDKRGDWKTVSIGYMEKALREKFTQHQSLKDQLLATGSAVLIENAGKNDAFYGAGADGKGRNILGQLLMHIRTDLIGNPNGQAFLRTRFQQKFPSWYANEMPKNNINPIDYKGHLPKTEDTSSDKPTKQQKNKPIKDGNKRRKPDSTNPTDSNNPKNSTNTHWLNSLSTTQKLLFIGIGSIGTVGMLFVAYKIYQYLDAQKQKKQARMQKPKA